MIKISKKVEYSLIVLQHLYSEKEKGNLLVTVRNICDVYNTPFDTTSKVMQIMCSHNILESIQGTRGGYGLSKNLDEISYYQLAELVEEKKLYVDCFEQKCNLLSSCNIITPISDLNKKIKTYLEKLTIEELLQGSSMTSEITSENYSRV